MVRVPERRYLLAATVSVALLLVACGSGDDDDAAPAGETGQRAVLATQNVEPASDVEAAYFLDIQGALELFGTAARRATQGSLDLGTGDRAAFFEPLVAAGAGTAFLPVVERLREIDPPTGYEADHALLLQQYEELARIDALLGESVREGDYVGFEIYNDQLATTGQRYLSKYSANLCNTISRGEPVCGAAEPGGYQAEMSLFFLELFPAAVLHLESIDAAVLNEPGEPDPLAFVSREEHLELIARRAALARDFRQEANDRLLAIEPPPEYADWHASQVSLGQIALDENDAVHAAASAGDFAELATLFFQNISRAHVAQVAIPASLCRSFTFVMPCGAPDAPSDPYDAALFDISLQLIARTAPLNAVPAGRPGVLSDEERGAIVAANRGLVIDAYRAALAALDALQPPAEAAADHARVVEFAVVEVGLLEQQQASALAGDLLAIDEDGPEIAASTARFCTMLTSIEPARSAVLRDLTQHINEDFECDAA